MASKTKLTALALLLGTALAIPAIAQTGTVTQYAACPDPPPKMSQAEQDAAHVVFLAGKVAYDEGDYTKAVESFKDAYRRDCSKVALLNFIARAYEAKGDKAEAVNALETYLKRNPKAEDAESVRRRIDNLKAQIAAQPTVTATGTATATATGTGTATAPTATSTSTAAPPERGHTAGPWVVVGVGGAALVPGIILTIVGQGKYGSATDGCKRAPNGDLIPNSCPIADAEVTRRQDSGLLLRGFGIGLLAGGVALIAGGLIWHFVEPTGPAKEGKIRLSPVWQPGYAGLDLSGAF